MDNKNDENGLDFGDVKIEGSGFVSKNPIEYGAGFEKSPMEAFAEEMERENSAEQEKNVIDFKRPSGKDVELDQGPIGTQTNMFELDKADSTDGARKMAEAVPEAMADPVSTIIDVERVTENPIPTKPKKPSFDGNTIQSALSDSEREGGVILAKTTGPMRAQDPREDGGVIKETVDIGANAVMGKYEVGGFTVQYESKRDVIRSVRIRDYFDDIETAFASVTGDKYLMPVGAGYKISTISLGMPSISFNERQVYVYKSGQWKRV